MNIPVYCLAFGVWRLAFGVWRLALKKTATPFFGMAV
jgi:hypothetical protein